MWVDMFLGEMFLGRAPNTLFWGIFFWQTLGVALRRKRESRMFKYGLMVMFVA